MKEKILEVLNERLIYFTNEHDKFRGKNPIAENVLFAHMNEVRECILVVESEGIYKGVNSTLKDNPLYDRQSANWYHENVASEETEDSEES